MNKKSEMIFDNFKQTNKLIFARLKNTINNEENKIMGNLIDLKRRVNVYFNEEGILSTKLNEKNTIFPTSNVKLRKESNSDEK
jgi:hypothetical protein